jgi:hypothetical protein
MLDKADAGDSHRLKSLSQTPFFKLMSSRFFSKLFLGPVFAALILAGAALVLAQTGPAAKSPAKQPPIDLNNPGYAELNLTTKIGSFKLLNGEGRVEMNFSGTMLVSNLDGTVATSGNLRKEYSDDQRQAWHGTGKIVVTGRFRAIQWFGTNLSGKWKGAGRARIYGEFDQNLETGYYWYSDDPERKIQWSMYGIEIGVPEVQTGGTAVPRERGGRPGGG